MAAPEPFSSAPLSPAPNPPDAAVRIGHSADAGSDWRRNLCQRPSSSIHRHPLADADGLAVSVPPRGVPRGLKMSPPDSSDRAYAGGREGFRSTVGGHA